MSTPPLPAPTFMFSQMTTLVSSTLNSNPNRSFRTVQFSINSTLNWCPNQSFLGQFYLTISSMWSIPQLLASAQGQFSVPWTIHLTQKARQQRGLNFSLKTYSNWYRIVLYLNQKITIYIYGNPQCPFCEIFRSDERHRLYFNKIDTDLQMV